MNRIVSGSRAENLETSIIEFLKSLGPQSAASLRNKVAALLGEESGARALLLKNLLDFTESSLCQFTVVTTHNCQQRCVYCPIKKENVKMQYSTMRQIIDKCVMSSKPNIALHFYGVEPLLMFGLIRRGVEELAVKAAEAGKDYRIIMSTNCIALNDDIIGFFKKHKVSLEIGLDGQPGTQEANRPGAPGYSKSYAAIKKYAKRLAALPQKPLVIMVTHPGSLHNLREDFFHIVEMGFSRIQLNFAQGVLWKKDEMRKYSRKLDEIAEALISDREKYGGVEFVNTHPREDSENTILLYSNEPSIDCDGSVYASNLFLQCGARAREIRIGSVLDSTPADAFMLKKRSRESIGRLLMGDELYNTDMEMMEISNRFAKKYKGRI